MVTILPLPLAGPDLGILMVRSKLSRNPVHPGHNPHL
jgi:hypothetical protein